MSSLRDQLLKAGVANKKQHQQARTQNKQQKKQGVDPKVEQRARLEAERKQQVERDKELNRQREAERKEKEKQAQPKAKMITEKSSLHEMRTFIKEHNLSVSTSGTGRTKEAIHKDIVDELRKRQ